MISFYHGGQVKKYIKTIIPNTSAHEIWANFYCDDIHKEKFKQKSQKVVLLDSSCHED